MISIPSILSLFLVVLLSTTAANAKSIHGLRGHASDNVTDIAEPSVEEPPRQTLQVLTVPTKFSGLDENFVSLSLLAAKIALCADTQDVRSVPECSNANVFVSDTTPDKAIVVHSEQHDICFAAFQSTKPNIADWMQNLNMGMEHDVCSPRNGICCPTRQGFYDAYRNVPYYNEFEEALEKCKTTKCGNQHCKVVFTGGSQGGAAAMVGAIYHNPHAVITFGQPPTMAEPCYAYDTSRLYRFVNAKSIGGGLLYDPVPFLKFGPVDHMGHLFVLGDDVRNVAHYRDHEAPDITMVDWAIANVRMLHSQPRYVERLESLQVFPIGMDGWKIGSDCSGLGSECAFPHICAGGVCSTGDDGSKCDNGDQCNSGRCDGICKPKLSRGTFCNEHEDCISEKCSWLWLCN